MLLFVNRNASIIHCYHRLKKRVNHSTGKHYQWIEWAAQLRSVSYFYARVSWNWKKWQKSYFTNVESMIWTFPPPVSTFHSNMIQMAHIYPSLRCLFFQSELFLPLEIYLDITRIKKQEAGHSRRIRCDVFPTIIAADILQRENKTRYK